MLKNCAVDFFEICNVCTRKPIIKAAERIFNSDRICRSYCDFYFGVTFLEHSVCVEAADILLARLSARHRRPETLSVSCSARD